MALGGGPRNSTLEVAIYQYALFELNFDKAIILSLIQIIICLFFVFIGFFKLKGSMTKEKAEKACALSIDKYCSVAATLKAAGAVITWEVEIL